MSITSLGYEKKIWENYQSNWERKIIQRWKRDLETDLRNHKHIKDDEIKKEREIARLWERERERNTQTEEERER